MGKEIKDRAREERLASALRDNLRRRKAQSRPNPRVLDQGDVRNPPETEVGRIDALFRRGMAILAHSATADDWPEAISLIEEAASAGHLKAAEQRALFECMGLGRRPDWEKGLDELADAANRGSATAAGALILLSENRFCGTAPKDLPKHHWSKVRSRIRIGERLRPPPARVLSSAPLILTIQGFASPAECLWLIRAAERRLERAFVVDPSTGQRKLDTNRTNKGAAFPIVEMDVVVEMLRARITAALRVPPAHLEVMQVLHYSVGEEFRPHHDFFDPSSDALRSEAIRNGQRAATLLVYLNDDFAGGGTEFPKIDLSFRGRTGDALLFSNLDRSGQPDPLTLHAGLPPTSGEKWILSQWVRDRPLTTNR